MKRRLALDQFAAQIPQWYAKYAGSPYFTPYERLEAGLSQKARYIGYLEKGDLLCMAIWGGDEERHGLGTKICGSNSAEDVIERTREAIQRLDNPLAALKSLRCIRYLGTAYGSKVLRCVCPENYGALDYHVRTCCGLPPQFDEEESELAAYSWFLDICRSMRGSISVPGPRPGGVWFIADVEMAIFQFALPLGYHCIQP